MLRLNDTSHSMYGMTHRSFDRDTYMNQLSNQSCEPYIKVDVYKMDDHVIIECFVPYDIQEKHIAYSINDKQLHLAIPVRRIESHDDHLDKTKGSFLLNQQIKLPCLVEEEESMLLFQNAHLKMKLPKRKPIYRPAFLFLIQNWFKL